MTRRVASSLVLLAAVVLVVARREAAWTPPAMAQRAEQAPRAFNPAAFTLSLQPFASGFDRPLFVAHAGDGSGRVFVVEQGGKVWIVGGGAKLPQPFIDIAPLLGASTGEQGLLGLAFHPGYAANGRFFLAYTGANGDNTVAEFRVSPTNVNQAIGAPRSVLLAIADFATNHNGGMIAFGPDRYLYIGTGDGGGGGDPQGNGQRLDTLLGKILRIDVDRTDPGLPYAIPATNPILGLGQRREIWAYGLRNPWRFSFDRANGDLYIADVGQGAREEVNFQAAFSAGGSNYGWNRMEGSICYPPGAVCDPTAFTGPVLEYDHSLGCSITGGYVYRGGAHPVMAGGYFYGDLCSGRIWTGYRDGGGVWRTEQKLRVSENISSFGEDEAGELYLVRYNTGIVSRLAASTAATPIPSPTATPAAGAPSFISPTPGSTLPGSAVLFQWSSAAGALEYALNVGNSAGSGEYFARSVGFAQSVTVFGLPTDGRTIHARLSYRTAGGWSFIDATFRAAGGTGTPAPTPVPTFNPGPSGTPPPFPTLGPFPNGTPPPTVPPFPAPTPFAGAELHQPEAGEHPCRAAPSSSSGAA